MKCLFNVVQAPRLLALCLMALTTQTWADDEAPDVMIDSRARGEELFYQCAALINDGARLACFDSIAQGKEPNMLQKKRPLDLSKTVISTFKGEPQVVLAEQAALSDKTVHAEQYTPLSLAYDLDKNSESGLWKARPHNPMYILPLFMNTKPNRHISTPNQDISHHTHNQMRTSELKFQMSFKSKLAEDLFGTNADLWAGYTQQSHWQVYNEDNSRPFRAHDYQPEIFVTQPVRADLPFGGKLRMLGAGAVHHSNGESDPLSRSWNRAYVMGGMEWGNLTVMPRFWGRIAKSSDSAKPDDNPDILDYYGYGDVRFLYQLQEGNNISGLVRYNPKTNKGALQLDYVYPLGKGVSGYLQFFQGYGQSIVDYNHESTAIGVGVMLNDWLGL
ncbi:MAG: phospholipase A [Moraxella sp.]|nr:phospholipase A [Moraxella sp.]